MPKSGHCEKILSRNRFYCVLIFLVASPTKSSMHKFSHISNKTDQNTRKKRCREEAKITSEVTPQIACSINFHIYTKLLCEKYSIANDRQDITVILQQ